jgi:surface polysaccharide O-acyltransferase-like enzyme
MSLPKQNIAYLDTLRVISTIGVIIIHVCTPVVKMTFPVDLSNWWMGNFIDSAVRFCVPMFLVLSGATMLGRTFNLKEFYKKRFLRVFLPFLFWALVYIVYSWLIEDLKLRPYSIHSGIEWVKSLIVKKGISTHFWFIYMLLVLYLFMPFLGRFVQKLNNKMLFGILALWFVTAFFFQFGFWKTAPYHILHKTLFYLRFAGYMVLGYYLMKFDFSALKYKITGLALFVVTILFFAFYTYHVSIGTGVLNLSTYYYLSPVVILQTVGVYWIFAQTESKKRFCIWVRKTLSDLSYGIYLVHIIVIGILFLNNIYWKITYPIISVPLISFAVLIISACIIFILRKIPGFSTITG